MKIAAYIDIKKQPTVIRLDHLGEERPQWISDSFFITDEVSRHIRSLKNILNKEQGLGIFLIGHYGSGKSHFLAYLSQQIQFGKIADRPVQVFPLSLINFPAERSLEAIFCEVLGIKTAGEDRRNIWAQVDESFPEGLVVVIDELSEFLRSKPTANQFNEDIRFLQFLGEWAQNHRLWLIAALQEQIEHTGEMEFDLYRKIKDRYPIRFLLTATHVKDLIGKKIIRKKANYAEAAESLVRQLQKAFPDFRLDFEELTSLYPMHPITIDLLEEVRDRFSQARGIVEFTMSQLLGSDERGIAAFVDEPWGALLGPDRIVDHFHDLFEFQPEFLPLAQKVFPYYRKNMARLFTTKAQCDLAWRLLKLLILVYLSPARQRLPLQDAVYWLLFKVTSIDPKKNVAIVEKILQKLTTSGSFVAYDLGGYFLQLKDESRERLEHLVAQEVEEIRGKSDLLFESLTPLLADASFNPFTLKRDAWQEKIIRWHFHERPIQIFFGDSSTTPPVGSTLQIGLPWGKRLETLECYRLIPERIEITGEILELAALQRIKERPQAKFLLRRVEESMTTRKGLFATLVRNSYQNARFINPSGAEESAAGGGRLGDVKAMVQRYGEHILRRTYPRFEEYAPSHGPLPKEAYRQLMEFLVGADIGDRDAPDFVRLIREAYLVPMGLLKRKGLYYSVDRNLDKHELLGILQPVLEHQPSPKRIYRHLAAPIFGLVADQVSLLLIFLLIQGEIDILKGNKSYRDLYETLSNPIQYDRVIPGSALSLEQLRDLEVICEGLHIQLPRQWSVLSQKRYANQLKRFGQKQRDLLLDHFTRLHEMKGSEVLVQKIEKQLSLWGALEKGDHEIQALQQFLYEIGSPLSFLKDHQELQELPPRFEKIYKEIQRFQHLFGFPVVLDCPDKNVAVGLTKISTLPSLDDLEASEVWLEEAANVYELYRDWYRQKHSSWQKSIGGHAIWSYRYPAIFGSAHLGLSDKIDEFKELLQAAAKTRCHAAPVLEFQPICRCGYNGQTSLLDPILKRFEELRVLLETQVNLFFQQASVEKKVRQWVDKKMEINTQTLSYLEGTAPYPDIRQVDLFDQHIAGLQLVHEVDATEIFDLIADRIWQVDDLLRVLGDSLKGSGPRVRIKKPLGSEDLDELAIWCLEQTLRTGRALPKKLTLDASGQLTERLKPEWVSHEALLLLDVLGLPENSLIKILKWLVDGIIPLPKKIDSGPVAAAQALLSFEKPDDGRQLQETIIDLYRNHRLMSQVAPKPWLQLLDSMATTTLKETPPSLIDCLKGYSQHQWLAIDALGLPLVDAILPAISTIFGQHRCQDTRYAMANQRTDTDSFYQSLVAAGINKKLEKIDIIDTLIHKRNLSLVELEQIAAAEFEIACKRMAKKIDLQQPILIFADHGFRLSADGGTFEHGGSSTLERIVPIFELLPS